MKQASNDSFADHGIDHISASQINTFIMNPCKWILKVSGYTDPTGNAHMWRGTAVDNAVSAMLMDGLSKEEAMALGKNVFETKVAYAKKVDPENINAVVLSGNQGKLERYLSAALDFFEGKGKPKSVQEKIEIKDESLSIPIIGYLDLKYESTIRDIKTSAQRPNHAKMPDSVSRQMSVYWKATGLMPVADYIIVRMSDILTETYPVYDINEHWAVTLRAAQTMQRVLSISTDIQEVASFFMPDFSTWDWDAKEIEEAKKLWGIK